MSKAEQRTGVIYYTHDLWGKICDDQTKERFHYFTSEVIGDGPMPSHGDRVKFRVSPKVPKPGMLRSAFQVEVTRQFIIAAGFRDGAKAGAQ